MEEQKTESRRTPETVAVRIWNMKVSYNLS